MWLFARALKTDVLSKTRAVYFFFFFDRNIAKIVFPTRPPLATSIIWQGAGALPYSEGLHGAYVIIVMVIFINNKKWFENCL